MTNEIGLKPIKELFDKSYFIPAYQRGYRWTKSQVNDLLDDIYEFATKTKVSKKEFYCLQPIIVKYQDKKDRFEIIDGQQRLTTLLILLKYLKEKHLKGDDYSNEYGISLYKITYETRPELANVFDNLSQECDTDIDSYHITQAYKIIDDWFELKDSKRSVRDSIINTLVENFDTQKESGIVQVIWYEIKDVDANPIDTFIRINLGKISLTNAELIKALFLQERNFGDGNAAKLKQLEIAGEWDRIENALQDENFWWFLNKNENRASSHIEFIFDMQRKAAIEDNPLLSEELGNDQFTTFRYYYRLIGANPNYSKIKELWDKVISYYETFKEWYSNPEWYHYIGFLVSQGRSVDELKKLLNSETIKTKEQATSKLLDLIKKEFEEVAWIEDVLTPGEYHLNIDYKTDKGLLRKFFLLFNLEYIIEKSKQESLIYYFPFKSFKWNHKSKTEVFWDIEHVNSATDNSLDKEDDQLEWLRNVILDVPNLEKELKERILRFLDKPNKDGFEDLFNTVIELIEDDSITDLLKNSIGNLTLLDAGTNRGYGNALFTTKRRIVIEKDKKGVFVPICTKNVFLKYFDGNLQTKWTAKDIDAYREFLELTMTKFIKPRS